MLYDWKYPFNEKLGKLMKKNRIFIFILALMMTLLLVVGCDVSPSMNSNFVRASLTLSSNMEKGIVIHDSIADVDKYRIALIPNWDTLDNGVSIHGGFGSVDSSGNILTFKEYTKSDISSIDLGYITPGKWSIYVEGINSSGVVVQSGRSTSYFTKDSVEAVVFLLPAGGSTGEIIISISTQQLMLDEKDYVSNYALKYKLVGVNSEKVYEDYLDKGIVSDNRIHYSKTIEGVQQGDYQVVITLENNGRVIGGITRVIRVVAKISKSDISWVSGDLTPEDFVPVELEIPAPSISAEMTEKPSGDIKKEASLGFCCKDTTGNGSGYNRKFLWYVNGVQVLETTSTTDTSTFDSSCFDSLNTFNSYFSEIGRYEVRCEIVYYTANISYIGGASASFNIIP